MSVTLGRNTSPDTLAGTGSAEGGAGHLAPPDASTDEPAGPTSSARPADHGNHRPSTVPTSGDAAVARSLAEFLAAEALMRHHDEVPDLLELLAQQRPVWHAHAACRDESPDAFFADGRHPDAARALAACARCPVRDICLASALADPSVDGIWGGTTARQRRRLRRSQLADTRHRTGRRVRRRSDGDRPTENDETAREAAG